MPFVVACAHVPDGTNYPWRVDRLDEDREVVFDDEPPVLPDQTRDDTPEGWGERAESNDDRLLAERPPHWD
jgi:hypothetical protein